MPRKRIRRRTTCVAMRRALARLAAGATVLKLSRRGLTDDDALATWLKSNTTLTSLKLIAKFPRLEVSEDGVRALADALASNQSIELLALKNNSVGNGGACALAGALMVNASLQKLDLCGNGIGDTTVRVHSPPRCARTRR
mmetsp:Transcript_25165/g.61256  ORF Transcript_25165/g.61256 Transcript_25165/m.61256 type:complete len:141 (+) Transcript_25165:2-424(+)